MLEILRSRYPALLALLAQLLALAVIACLLLLFVRLVDWRPSLWQAALAQGALAAALGQWLGLRRWWLALNLAFVPGLLALQSRQWPAWWFLVAFGLAALPAVSPGAGPLSQPVARAAGRL